jgi:hypothetical protein
MRKFIAPPYFENGNPLNAYGVNQIIESVNALESEFMDFKMLRPKMLIKEQMKSLSSQTSSKNGFILLKTFSHLRVAGISSGGNNIRVFLRRVGQADVEIGSSNAASFDISINLNGLGADTPNAGELYIIFLTSSLAPNDTTINYIYEYKPSLLTMIAINTITNQDVIDKTYLNKFVDNIRNLPELAPSNPPFRGVGGRVVWPSVNNNYINQFAKWEGARINNFLRMRFRTKVSVNFSTSFHINVSGADYNIGSFYAQSQFPYDYVLNFTTRAWTITNAVTDVQAGSGTAPDGIQNIIKGTFYEFRIQSESNTTSNYFYVDYVLESKNPL